MKQEQRFFLALGLTLGILLFWTTFFPPARPQELAPPSIASNSQQLPNGELMSEGTDHYTVGTFRLEAGQRWGGIREMVSRQEEIKCESNPALFQMEQGGPPWKALPFSIMGEEGSLIMHSIESDEIEVTKIFSEDPRSPTLIRVRIEVKNKGGSTSRPSIRLVAYRPMLVAHAEDKRYQDGFILAGEKVQKIRAQRGREVHFKGPPEWITAQGKSNVLVLKPQRPIGTFHVEQSPSGGSVGWLQLPEVELAPEAQSHWDFVIYAGPMLVSQLKAIGMEETISYGSFSWISKILLSLLNQLYNVLHNYGAAIVVLSLGIWLLFFPITWSSVRMMREMAKLQPKIERLREQYKNSPQKLNEEVLKIYRAHRVNPLSGCLPLLLQMPIFIALYQVLSRSPQLRGAEFLWIKDLSAPDAFIRFPHSIPILGSSFNLLPFIMAVGMFFQQRFSRPSMDNLTDEQRIQQNMFKWFPIVFGFLFYSLPSGLVLYWVTNTFFGIGQQMLYLRSQKE